jgi:protoheme ferro-lyase
LDFSITNATKHKWLQPGRENPNLKVTKDQLHKETSEAEEEDGKKKAHIYCRVYTYPHHSELTAQHPGQQQQAAIALPLLAAHSMRAMASYRHFVMSNNATTSPFRTTGKCLNLPAPSTFLSSASCHLLQKTPRQTSIK